ncbi:MAG: hypothetical protein AB1465_06250 [Patescibacteria group bacterium]
MSADELRMTLSASIERFFGRGACTEPAEVLFQNDKEIESAALQTLILVFFNMPKKTRAQKEKTIIHRMKQLDNIVKLSYGKRSATNVESHSIISGSNKFLNLENSSESDQDSYLSSDIKKSLIVAVVFFFIIITLYFLENKYQFIATFGQKLINLVL